MRGEIINRAEGFMSRVKLIVMVLAFLALTPVVAGAERSIRKVEYEVEAKYQADILQAIHGGYRSGWSCRQGSRITARCYSWTDVYTLGQKDPCSVCHPGSDTDDHIDRYFRFSFYRIVSGRLVINRHGEGHRRIV